MNNTLTALKNVRVGHSTHLDKLTGCTYIHFDTPYPTAYHGSGGNIGSFNTESIKSTKTGYKENGIFIAGGSITGLTSSAEIIDCLRNDHIGMNINGNYNPSITGAILFDQGMFIAPYDKIYGKEAYQNLTSDPVQSGNVGAGTGTSVGKFRWVQNGTKTGAMKAGVGSARIDLGNGITVCAMSVVNALGNIILPNGKVLSGNRDEETIIRHYENVQDFVTNDASNTTISVVGINVDLRSKEHYEKIAQLAAHGQVRAINPVNTSTDGDSIFVFSTEEIKKPLNSMGQYFLATEDDIFFIVDIIGHAAAKAVQESIYDACRSAESVSFEKAWQGVIPSCHDYTITNDN